MRVFLFIVAIIGVYILSQDGGEANITNINMTPDMKTSVATAIKQSGFNCPKVILAHNYGQNAYGTVTRVYCSNNISFNVTLTPNSSYIIKPWN